MQLKIWRGTAAEYGDTGPYFAWRGMDGVCIDGKLYLGGMLKGDPRGMAIARRVFPGRVGVNNVRRCDGGD